MKVKKIKACLICNPIAGKVKKRTKIINQIISYLNQEGYEVSKMITDGPLTAMQIAKDAAYNGTEVIIATGGDGTINEIANGIYGTNSILMILPMGTANLLAHHIKIPLKISKALKAYKNSDIININVGKANNRYFLLMVGVGFDSYIISKIKPETKLKYGKLAFIYNSIKASFFYNYPSFTIKTQDKIYTSSFSVVSLSKEYAVFFSLTPKADITKDKFQMCIFHKTGALNYWKYFLFALLKKHYLLKDVTLAFSDELEIISNNNSIIWSQIDGELYCKLPIKISMASKKLKLLVPYKTKLHYQSINN